MALGLRGQAGVAAPPYTKGPYTWDQRVSFTQGVSGVGVNVYNGADVWYVDKTNVSASGDGKSWGTAFKTITEAVAAAGDYDVIFVGPGFYTEVATQTITQVGLKIIGCNSSGKTRGPCSMKGPSGGVTTPMITIAVNANDTEIANISFIATGAGKAIQLGDAGSGYVWRTHIHDCAFFGDSTGTYAISPYGFTTGPTGSLPIPDTAELVIENCNFYAWTTACIGNYGTRTMIRNNSMFVPASAIGIDHGEGRPFGQIIDNKIIGANSSDTGIKLAGDDDSATIIANNTITNCATTMTQDKGDNGIASNNWTYSGK